MAKRKAKAKAAPTTFPKEQSEEGAPDRFIPPDRHDQIPNDESDRAQVVLVKSLADNIEVVDDDGDDEGDDEERDDQEEEEDEEREIRSSRRRTRARASADDREPAEGDDEDDSRHSRKVRARINREKVLRSQADVRADNAERRAKGVEERLAKLERVTAEVKESGEVKALEAKLATAKAKLATAIEDGKTADQLAYTIEIGDLQADIKLLKRDMEAAKRQAITEEAQRKEDETKAAAATEGTADAEVPSADDYIQANRWWNKPKFSRERRRAISLDTEILEEISSGELNIEKYSDEHFELLNERLAEMYPELPLYTADGQPYEPAEEEDEVSNRDRDSRDNGRERQNSRRPPVGGQGTGRNGRRQVNPVDLARQGKVKLGDPEYTTMRLFGLDPKKPEHKKAFAKERMRSILTDERRGTNQRGAR